MERVIIVKQLSSTGQLLTKANWPVITVTVYNASKECINSYKEYATLPPGIHSFYECLAGRRVKNA
jgi:hypothetical protein